MNIDLVYALRWTLTFLFISLMYLFAVKQGICPNYVALWSSSISEKYLKGSGGGGQAAKVEL